MGAKLGTVTGEPKLRGPLTCSLSLEIAFNANRNLGGMEAIKQ